MTSKQITTIVRDYVKSTSKNDYLEWMTHVNEELATYRGFLGLEVVPPKEVEKSQILEYHIIFRFNTFEDLKNWQQSDFLNKRLKEVSQYLHSTADIQHIDGMELWYDMSDQKTSNQKPLYWKQVIVTVFTVYPLILLADLLLNLFFPMRSLKPEIAIFFTVVVVGSSMVYPVMPFITKLVGQWLHRK